MKFAICNEQFEGWDFERVCRYVKGVGYDGLEVAPFTLAPRITDVDKARRAELRRQADGAGVRIIGLHWLLAGTEGFYLTSPDEAVRARTAQYLVDLAEATQDFGGDLMVFGSPKQRSLLEGVTWDQAFAYATDTFRRAMPAVAAHNVSLCMEPLGPSETDFVNTAAEGARLMDAVGHPNFVLHLDVKAMSSEPTPVPAIIRQYANRTGHFHANDPNRRGPGFGDVDFVPIFQALKESGYDRWVSVEVFDYTPDPETIAEKSIEYMSACAARPDDGMRFAPHEGTETRRARRFRSPNNTFSGFDGLRDLREAAQLPAWQRQRRLTAQLLQVPSANRAGFELVVVRPGPVGLEADPAAVAVAAQRVDLTPPVDPHFSDRAPHRFVILDEAVLRVDVADAVRRQRIVAVGKRGLAEDRRIRRIPDQL